MSNEGNNMSNTEKLEAALAAALPELDGAKKRANNPHFKSKYADLGAVIEAIEPIATHGIWYRQVLHESDLGVKIETLYTGFGATISAGVLFMPADKRNAQGFGSALTYARRYALQSAFGLATEDDDGNAASEPAKPALISDADCAEIISLIEASGADAKAFCNHFGIKSVKELPVTALETAKRMLHKKLAEKAKPADDLADDAAFLGEGA
jgi:hypothetical protein